MTELINTRCVQGRLILTDTAIIVSHKLMGRNDNKTLPRSAFTSLELKDNRSIGLWHGRCCNNDLPRARWRTYEGDERTNQGSKPDLRYSQWCVVCERNV